ncbi:AAA domain (dynein-related subfamily) [Acetomicrobium thermoterrenum DSM 13490]|uniref:AAA domain (Dynein-related subfamily) n=1 Tax=Acetomicrobium thermoterrenum DSM 13490 TaxID=1120987 RepID=A0A1H3FYE0_9BACT|nr:AAA family ATPase [Acetomicrobium thermoterrenum]SDX96011.1 AAA domain (dynein-related subfamily) [Acetomicrobium thermoterrenum DSM 13490]
MEKQIFIFTAGNSEARQHLEISIKNPINLEKIIKFFESEDQEELRLINSRHGIYAWGAMPGPSNERLWNELKPDDYVLCVYDNTYHYVAKILKKCRNEKCAQALWGSDSDGHTWEFMYFLSRPEKIEIPVQSLSQYLNKSYRGFTRISAAKVQTIEKDFGSIDEFIEKELKKFGPVPNVSTKPINAYSVIENIISHIQSNGFVYEPWQIAQYVTAVRTKPFMILAGISGTGKSKLPALVAEAISGKSRLIPVRPDWTDSSDILGYVDLQGDFRPGVLLEIAREAMNDRNTLWTCIIDEMNLARVEHYFAEVLSKIECRHGTPELGYDSDPLLLQSINNKKDVEWSKVILPSNLCLVGTVNMDESSHSFSRKVLDRAFTIELSDVYLDLWKKPQITATQVDSGITRNYWPISKWYPRALRLSELNNLKNEEEKEIARAIEALKDINKYLALAQLQVGYRIRDEVALFLINALEIQESFKGRNNERVDPLDLALEMKILPRIVGGSSAIRRVILGMLGWAMTGEPLATDEDAWPILENWEGANRTNAINDARYPRLAARLCLMWGRLVEDGYTSYWL